MYSIVLFIVETSLSGLSGPAKAPVGRREDFENGLVGDTPSKSHAVADPQLVGQRDELVVESPLPTKTK